MSCWGPKSGVTILWQHVRVSRFYGQHIRLISRKRDSPAFFATAAFVMYAREGSTKPKPVPQPVPQGPNMQNTYNNRFTLAGLRSLSLAYKYRITLIKRPL